VYTVSHAATLAGVAPPTLRAWERRYGVVSPKRTAGGYRVYDDADVRRLRAMQVLVLAGWSTRSAAEKVQLDGEDVELATLTEQVEAPIVTDTIGVLAQLATQFDPPAVDEALDLEFGRGPIELVADSWLMPALAELGSAWQAGRISIGAEHLMTSAVQRRLASIFDASVPTTDGPLILTGLPGGAKHELGILTFSILLRRAGANVHYLGGDMPTPSWVESVTQLGPAAIVLGVATMGDVTSARDIVNALRATCPDVEVYVGGGAQASVHVAAHSLGHNLLSAANKMMEDLEILGELARGKRQQRSRN
jgi:MerR family transcriptional regulator, light-induced transcriptional regulator